jgi:hypothetical protein
MKFYTNEFVHTFFKLIQIDITVVFDHIAFKKTFYLSGSVSEPVMRKQIRMGPHHFGKPDPHQSRKVDPDPHQRNSGELWSFKMEPWKVCIPLVADSYHFDH